MRPGRAIVWMRSAVEGLRSSPRRAWLTTFVLATLLSGLWAWANPLFAAPDEQTHVIRAVALDHGQLIGEKLAGRFRELQTDRPSFRVVQVPEVYEWRTPCFAFQPEQTPTCQQFAGSTRNVDSITTAGRHPPAYYAVVGIASRVWSPGSGTVRAMRLMTAAVAGALIASAANAIRRTASSIVTTGMLFALTPMALFLSGTVNPSAPEIAGAIALWTSGLVLVSRSEDRVDNRLVNVAGISACVLVLSRQLAPLWLGVIAATALMYGNRASLRNILRSGVARLWAIPIAACILFQVGWVIVVKPLDTSVLARPEIDATTSEIVRSTLGAGFTRYREMIGVFGWQDTAAPALTYVFWTGGIGLLTLLALAWSKRRHVAVLLALLAVTVVAPLALEGSAYRDVGGIFWQGRYTLPIAVGIPILATMAIAATGRAEQVVRPRLALVLGIGIAIAHILAFAQNLRRYTVGYRGEIQYWKNATWSPPVSPLLLTIAYVIIVTAFVGWVYFSVHRGNQDANA
jgi:Predicted membrane protein (DUF2142)